MPPQTKPDAHRHLSATSIDIAAPVGFDSLAVLETLPVSVVVVVAGTVSFANASARQLAGVLGSHEADGLYELTQRAPDAEALEAHSGGVKGCEDRMVCGPPTAGLHVIRQWRANADRPDVLNVTIRPARTEELSDESGARPDDRLAEQQSLVHAEKLATVGQLAAGMAHEINNPVCYVQSNLGSLREYLNKLFGLIESLEGVMHDERMSLEQRVALIEEHKRRCEYTLVATDLPLLLQECLEGVERIRNIVQNLRDFSRIDTAEGFRLFDIHRAIDTTLGIVRTLAGGSTRFSTDYETLPLIECNPTELNQVLMNILVNATQAVDRDGVIEIRTGQERERVWIEVRDNGCGIDELGMRRIFEPFYTTKEVGKGTGLGLSISHGIVKKHGGEITVRSRPGQGTVFRILLPVRQHQPHSSSGL